MRREGDRTGQDSGLAGSRPCSVAASGDEGERMNTGDDSAVIGAEADLSDLRQEVTDVLTWKMTAVAELPSFTSEL